MTEDMYTAVKSRTASKCFRGEISPEQNAKIADRCNRLIFKHHPHHRCTDCKKPMSEIRGITCQHCLDLRLRR